MRGSRRAAAAAAVAAAVAAAAEYNRTQHTHTHTHTYIHNPQNIAAVSRHFPSPLFYSNTYSYVFSMW